MPLLQCTPSEIVALSYCHLFAKIGALDPTNNRKRCLEVLGAAGASSNYAPKGLVIQWQKDYSFLNLMFFRLSRIIVDIMGSLQSYVGAGPWPAAADSRPGSVADEGA